MRAMISSTIVSALSNAGRTTKQATKTTWEKCFFMALGVGRLDGHISWIPGITIWLILPLAWDAGPAGSPVIIVGFAPHFCETGLPGVTLNEGCGFHMPNNACH